MTAAARRPLRNRSDLNLEILKNVHMLTFGGFPQIEDKK
jgi:hypothetical protein